MNTRYFIPQSATFDEVVMNCDINLHQSFTWALGFKMESLYSYGVEFKIGTTSPTDDYNGGGIIAVGFEYWMVINSDGAKFTTQELWRKGGGVDWAKMLDSEAPYKTVGDSDRFQITMPGGITISDARVARMATGTGFDVADVESKVIRSGHRSWSADGINSWSFFNETVSGSGLANSSASIESDSLLGNGYVAKPGSYRF